MDNCIDIEEVANLVIEENINDIENKIAKEIVSNTVAKEEEEQELEPAEKVAEDEMRTYSETQVMIYRLIKNSKTLGGNQELLEKFLMGVSEA